MQLEIYTRVKRRTILLSYSHERRENFIWKQKSVCHYMRKHLTPPTPFFSYLLSSLTLSFYIASCFNFLLTIYTVTFFLSQLIWLAISKYDDEKIIHSKTTCRDDFKDFLKWWKHVLIMSDNHLSCIYFSFYKFNQILVCFFVIS